MSFGPQKVSLPEIGINALGSLIAGIAGGITILVILFILGDLVSVSDNLINRGIEQSGSPLFLILMSIVTLIGTSVSVLLTTKILAATSAGKYRNNSVTYTQIGFFMIFLYIFITPIYIWSGMINFNNIMIVFLLHVLLLKFGMSIILEAMNNYRYIMIGIYGSFLGLIIAGGITFLIFESFSSGLARLIALVVLLPIINFTMMSSKQLFSMAYYSYYKFAGIDTLGDIFSRIEAEEEEALKQEEQKNTI